MNVKEYIESGVLELYVLGKLSEAERQEVEQNIAQYPELKTEVAHIEEAMEAYALLHQIKPSPGGFAKVQQKLGHSNTGRKKGGSSILPIVAGLLALLSVIALILLWNGRNNHRLQMATVQIQLDSCEQQLGQAEAQIDSLEGVNQQLQGKQTIYMDGESPGTNKAPQAVAAVEWNENTGEFSINPLTLPATGADKDYQLWAIVDGNPVDMLVFNTDADPTTTTTITFSSRPTAFAVTLEPRGGSPSPTLSEMYVLGGV